MYDVLLWICIYVYSAVIVSPLLCSLKKSRWLTTEDELLEFQALFQRKAGGSSVGMEYLRSSKVRGYRTKKGNLAAGYVINAQVCRQIFCLRLFCARLQHHDLLCNAQAPLRYFSWLDPEDRKQRPEDAVAEKDLVEITCIVFDSRQINYVDRGRIYLESITLAMETGEPRAAFPASTVTSCDCTWHRGAAFSTLGNSNRILDLRIRRVCRQAVSTGRQLCA